MNKQIHIIGGGTISHVKNHFALAAVAYGGTAKALAHKCVYHPSNIPKDAEENRYNYSSLMEVHLHLSNMAISPTWFSYTGNEDPHITNGQLFETYEDLQKLTETIVANPRTKMVFFNAAVVDFYADLEETGKDKERFKTSEGSFLLPLSPYSKLIDTIRKTRKDIFLVAFKATCGATEQEQYLAGLNMLKRSSANLVLANDTKTRLNMVITPEEAAYSVTDSRQDALDELVNMAFLRSHLTFTQSTIIDGHPIDWHDEIIPASLRTVVEHCIEMGAYKTFRGSTVGHFAFKINDTTFVTSKRKTNFNDIHQNGMVKIKTDGPDTVLAYGAKPSVGGQSQRIVFKDHPGYDCIVHCHVKLKPESKVPIRSQREFECGSMECGSNTSQGLMSFGNLLAVYLDKHGPNIVFPSTIDPKEVIDFLNDNFDLSSKSGGYQLES